MDQARLVFASFPEVTQVVSQVGRPDDGTDATGFFNTEYFVDLKPQSRWRPQFHENKEELIAAMDQEVEKIPGAIWGFSQPIADNMEEAVSGVKGELAVKIFGTDLKELETKANEIADVMRKVPGITDLGVFRVLGQPNVNLIVNRQKTDRFGINVADVQDAIQTAAGGNSSQPDSEGRRTLRPGRALPGAVPPKHRRYREYPHPCPVRRTGCARPAMRYQGGRRRVDDLSRGQLALHRHQVQRTRPRPRQHRAGGDEQSE